MQTFEKLYLFKYIYILSIFFKKDSTRKRLLIV